LKIYFACWPTPDQQGILTKAGAKNRLISYFYLKKKRRDLLHDIVETGLADYVERPVEPIDEIPLDVKILCGGWWKNEKI
jgi:hypothetical protein